MPSQRQGEQEVPLPRVRPRPDVARQPAEHRGGRLRDRRWSRTSRSRSSWASSRSSNGLAKVNFRTPDIRFSQLSVVAEPSDTLVGIFHGELGNKIKAKPRIATSKSPKPAIVGKTRTAVSIEVKVPGMQPKGWAAVKIGKQQYKGKLVDGKVTIKLPKFHDHWQEGAQGQVPRQRQLQARLQVHQPLGRARLILGRRRRGSHRPVRAPPLVSARWRTPRAAGRRPARASGG